MKKRKKWMIIFLVLFILLAIFLYYQNNHLGLSKYEIENKNIPSEFDGYKIIQISDLHSKEFGESQKKLVEKIKKSKPDIVVFTGDMVDRRALRLSPFLNVIKCLEDVTPMYYVFGNHEMFYEPYNENSKEGQRIRSELKKTNVVLLENEAVEIKRGEDTLKLLGISDPSNPFVGNDRVEMIPEVDRAKMSINMARENKREQNSFELLLSHRPELLDLYENEKIDLVLSGHAHGGQIRIPFIGGIIAPNQGFFPRITEGVHEKGETKLVVSRGLGNSLFPFRILNTPEIVEITLKKK